MNGHRKNAFTLVELLVVIGVIAILIAILLPALSKARQAAHVVACMSNLRQVGVSFVIHANEHRGRLNPVFSVATGTPRPNDYGTYTSSLGWPPAMAPQGTYPNQEWYQMVRDTIRASPSYFAWDDPAAAGISTDLRCPAGKDSYNWMYNLQTMPLTYWYCPYWYAGWGTSYALNWVPPPIQQIKESSSCIWVICKWTPEEWEYNSSRWDSNWNVLTAPETHYGGVKGRPTLYADGHVDMNPILDMRIYDYSKNGWGWPPNEVIEALDRGYVNRTRGW